MIERSLPPRFITFEGGEGAGKSTQISRVSEFLNSISIEHIVTREPGGSPGGEEIRKLLVSGEPSRWDAETETLLHFAARRDHLFKIIKPALKRGCWVLSDRYVDSTFAYQGYGHGISLSVLQEIHNFINDQLYPDLTFILDLPVDNGLERTLERNTPLKQNSLENRYELMGLEFHQRLRGGYLEIAQTNPSRCELIDARNIPDEVFEDIKNIINSRYLSEKIKDQCS